MESICLNHAFIAGNKRTAVVAAIHMLNWNGYDLLAEQMDLVNVTVEVAQHQIDREKLAGWIQEHAVPLDYSGSKTLSRCKAIRIAPYHGRAAGRSLRSAAALGASGRAPSPAALDALADRDHEGQRAPFVRASPVRLNALPTIPARGCGHHRRRCTASGRGVRQGIGQVPT